MNLKKYRMLLLVVTASLALIVASPALQRLLVYPQTDFFTEMWLLDSEHKTEKFQFNIKSNTNYNIFLGVGNRLGSCAYYSIKVKFRNQTQPAADSFDRTASSLPPLHSITVFVADKETWEAPLAFSFAYTYSENPVNANLSKVNVNSIMLNGVTLNLEDFSAAWDPEKNVFFGNLFFELWIYNEAVDGFTYHERFNDLKFNMTV